MNSKPRNISKTERMEIRITESDKDYIYKKAAAKSCSIGELVVDSVRGGYERRTQRDKERMKHSVVMQNYLAMMKRYYPERISEYEKMEAYIWR